MNKRQVVVLWIVALVLAVAAFFARSKSSKGFESKTERNRGQTLFADLPVAEVAKITVSSGENTSTLVRKDGKWSVADREDFPANVTNINEFLRSLSEVKVTQGVEAEPSFAPRFGMDPSAKEEKDRGTDVVLSNDAGTELAHVTFGKNLEAGGDPMSMFGGGSSGRFVRNHADQTGVYVVSELFSTLSAEPKRWLEDDFLKVEKIKSVSVSPPSQLEKIEWKLTRTDEAGEFTLDGAKPTETLDPNATAPVKSLFSYARFEDIVPKDKVDELADPTKKRVAKVETFEGFNYTFNFMPVDAEPQKVEDPNSPPPEQTYLMTVDVEATLPTERKKEEKETEEDAKTKDKAFADRKAELEKRLAAEKAFAGRYFKVTKWTVDALLKERAGLLQAAGQPATSTPDMIPGGMIPGGMIPGGAAPAPAPRRRVEAVTPPIEIPPLEESKEAAPKETPPPSEAPAPGEAPKPEGQGTEGQ